MALHTADIDGSNSVTADFTGTLVAKQNGGPAGAVNLYDDNGVVSFSVDGPEGPGSGQAYAITDLSIVEIFSTLLNAEAAG